LLRGVFLGFHGEGWWIHWWRILFWGTCENLWDFQCEDFNARVILFESSSQDRAVQFYVIHDPEPIHPSSTYSLTIITNNVCLSVCILAFGVQFGCAFEWDLLVLFHSLVIYCSFLCSVILDWGLLWLLFKVIVAVKLLQMQWLFWYAMLLYLCSSIVGLE